MTALSLRSESSDAVFVLMGYPGSGKSETGNTLIGEPVFDSMQESQCVSGDFSVTVRDTPGFENVSDFSQMYNSLKDYEKRKVVFGLTIQIGRFEPGFIEMLKSIFQDKEIGDHLKRKTFLIFTNIESLKIEKDYYQDKFKRWLNNSNIHELITSLDLNYCVIRNNQRGTKQIQQADQLFEQIKRILQSRNQEEAWGHFHSLKSVNDLYCATCLKKDESYKDFEFVGKLHQELKLNACEAVDLVLKLQSTKLGKEKTRTIHKALQGMGSHMTFHEVEELQNVLNRNLPQCRCNIL